MNTSSYEVHIGPPVRVVIDGVERERFETINDALLMIGLYLIRIDDLEADLTKLRQANDERMRLEIT
jgi:hypothetical protein